MLSPNLPGGQVAPRVPRRHCPFDNQSRPLFLGQLDLWEECCLFINLIITMISISMKHQGAAGVALQVEITAVSRDLSAAFGAFLFIFLK